MSIPEEATIVYTGETSTQIYQDAPSVQGDRVKAPPHAALEIYSGPNYSGNRTSILAGEEVGGITVGSIKYSFKTPWHVFAGKCCTGTHHNPTLCGDLWKNHPSHKCDDYMIKFCDYKDNYKKDVCSCLSFHRLEDAKIQQALPWFTPRCHYARCNALGYQTHGIVTQGCPDINHIDCRQQVNLQNIDRSKIVGLTLEQNCSAGETTQSQTKKVNIDKTSFAEKHRIKIIIGFFLIAAMVILYILLSTEPDQPPSSIPYNIS